MLRPANPFGWQQITNDWRERARAETCVRLSARLYGCRPSDARLQEWRIELDPRRVPIILAIGTGICVGLVGYLA